MDISSIFQKIIENQYICGIATGLLCSGILRLISNAIYGWNNFRIYKFWRAFKSKRQTYDVVFSEDYYLEGTEAEKSTSYGNRWASSTNIVHYVSRICRFVDVHLSPREINVCGNKTSQFVGRSDNIILLGGPYGSEYSEMIFKKLRDEYILPFDFSNERDSKNWEIRSRDGQTFFSPKFDDSIQPQITKDYALIMRTTLLTDSLKNIVIIAGCHVYGTEGAVNLITEENSLESIGNVRKYRKTDFTNTMMLVEINVQNNRAQSSRIMQVSEKYIHELEPYHSGSQRRRQ